MSTATHRQAQLAPGRKLHVAAGSDVCLGAEHDVARSVTTHLFGISANHSGSTFLQEALAACRAVWSLPDEGQKMAGFTGPASVRSEEPGEPEPNQVWAAAPRWVARFANPARYDWPRTRKAWYFQACARDPEAPVFYTKSPPHLLIVGELARRFRNAKFLFMVRNPYAVCEGICRAMEERRPHRIVQLQALFPGRSLPELAATHVTTCLAWQRANVDAYGDHGILFTYETMCAEPERVAQEVRALVPEIDDLDLRQRLPVKRRYHEMLTDMNARQLANLDTGRIAAFTRAFRLRRDLLDYFGYDLR